MVRIHQGNTYYVLAASAGDKVPTSGRCFDRILVCRPCNVLLVAHLALCSVLSEHLVAQEPTSFRGKAPSEICWTTLEQVDWQRIDRVAFSPDGLQLMVGSHGHLPWAHQTPTVLFDFTTGTKLLRLPGLPICAAFSPDGKQIVTGSLDGRTTVVDVRTGEATSELGRYEGAVTAVTFSPCGSLVLTGSSDGEVTLWDAHRGKPQREFTQHNAEVTCVAMSPDGCHMLTGYDDITAVLWCTVTGKRVHVFPERDATCAVFSPEGRYVVVGGFGGATVWDVANQRTVRQRLADDDETVTSLVFSPDGRRILIGTESNPAGVWDIGTGEKMVDYFTGHPEGVTAVSISPDEQRILTCSEKSIVWDVTTGLISRSFVGHQGGMECAAFSPDGRHVVTGGGDKTAILWDLENGTRLHTYRGHTDAVNAVAFNPNGGDFVTGANDGLAIIWDSKTGTERHRLSHPGNSRPNSFVQNSWVKSVAFSPDGTRVLTGCFDGRVTLWDAISGTLVRSFDGCADRAVLAVAFDGKGERILAGCTDGTVDLWNAGTGQRMQTFRGGPDEWFQLVAMINDQHEVFACSEEDGMSVWDAASGAARRRMRFDTRLESSVLNAQGARVLLGFRDGTAALWDTTLMKELRTFSGYRDLVEAAAITADGQRVFTVSIPSSGQMGGSLREMRAALWEVTTGKEVRSYTTPRGAQD